MLKEIKKNFDYVDIVWIMYVFFSYTFYIPTFYMRINLVTLFLYALPLLFLGKKILFENETYISIVPKQYLCLVWYLIFVAYEYVISVTNIINGTVWGIVRNNVILFFTMCYTIDTLGKFEKFLYDYAIGTLMFGMVAWLTSPLSSYGTLDFGGYPQRQRNFTAYVLGISYAIFFYFYLKNKFRRDIFFAILCAIITALTGSRKGLIQLVLPFAVLATCQKNAMKLWKYIVVTLLIGGILIVFLINNAAFMEVYGTRLLAIFNEDDDMSDMSVYARNTLKNIGIQAFLEKPIIGYGLGASWTLVERTGYSYVNYFHNNFIEILTCGGIIGFILYHGIIIKNTIVTFVRRKENKLFFLLLTILLTFLILSWGQVTVYYAHFTFIIFLCVHCGFYFEEIENENSNSYGL